VARSRHRQAGHSHRLRAARSRRLREDLRAARNRRLQEVHIHQGQAGVRKPWGNVSNEDWSVNCRNHWIDRAAADG